MAPQKFRSKKPAAFFFSTLVVLLLCVHETRLVTQLTCVHIPYPKSTPKTLGELYERNQLAFFLSSHLFTELSISSQENFAECPQTDISCTLNSDELRIPRCNPGDCACHAQKIAPYLNLVSHCKTVEVIGEVYSSTEFSGCTREAIIRYIRPQNGSYSVLVLSTSGSKTIPESQAQYMQRELCALSDKEIVVIADSIRRVPICEDRTLLATGLDDETIVSLIAGAENVATKGGGNAYMGVAGMNGGRLIIPPDTIAELSWASVDVFTVVGGKGTISHFDSAETMRQAVSGGQEAWKMLERGFSNLMPDDIKRIGEDFMWAIPKKRWSKHVNMVA